MLTPDPNTAVAYGMFRVSQARAAGISAAELTRGLRHGRWERVAPGVLRVADRAAHPADPLLLALLRLGPTAVVGYESAGYLLGWKIALPRKAQLLVAPSAHVARRAGTELHRAASRWTSRPAVTGTTR